MTDRKTLGIERRPGPADAVLDAWTSDIGALDSANIGR
jgi:hypothetical protein